MTPDSPTLYEVLGVCPDATDDQIKTAWRRAAKVTHPDAGGTSEAFAAARHAWEVLSDPARRTAYDADLAGEDDPDDEAADAFDVDPFTAWPWCAPYIDATPTLRHTCPGTIKAIVVAIAGIMAGIGWQEALEAVVSPPGFLGACWIVSVPVVVAVTWLAAITGIQAIMAGIGWLGWGFIGAACLWGHPWAVAVLGAGWVAWVAAAVWWWRRRMAWPARTCRAGNMVDMPEVDPPWMEPVELVAELIPSVRAMWSPDGQTVAVVAGRRVATLGMPMRGWRGIDMRGWNPIGADTAWIVDQIGGWLADQDKPLTIDGRILFETWDRLQTVRPHS
ncbi:J domain-containing protein [Cutibacterium acnes]|uniref:J domain-containing protein n=1 Tax=Cutibacterium acnes TaxID=1747 RepID=UPI0001F0909B|nr:J domain-containing protein [Cutibacterium acnes]EFT69619.1 DnaJ domain protein [Cutibacterium acnes HL038PA1]PGF38551.1 molecular chaperone DnaJ [Cutibacterium acnes subsp. defendens]REB06327.1 molecular chaperone DnaJ [Cutibacterium acnes]TLG17382.1 J domain-containing protein [Cutibacterium acnes]TMT32456.1 J domain-containing protein [Cutibacterium acnes]